MEARRLPLRLVLTPVGDEALRLEAFDAAYVDRLRAGDADTERHFASYFGELVLLKLRRRLRSRELIEDIRQETFLRVLRTVRAPGGLRDAASLGAYVNAVCNNVARELLRKDRRPEPVAEGSAPASPVPGPEATLLGKESDLMVQRIVAELPARDQALLKALFLDEAGRDEICARFGVDRAYLRVLLHRAKNQFRAQQARKL